MPLTPSSRPNTVLFTVSRKGKHTGLRTKNVDQQLSAQACCRLTSRLRLHRLAVTNTGNSLQTTRCFRLNAFEKRNRNGSKKSRRSFANGGNAIDSSCRSRWNKCTKWSN